MRTNPIWAIVITFLAFQFEFGLAQESNPDQNSKLERDSDGFPTASQDKSRESIKVGRYTFQSNVWVNLNERLFHEARFDTPPPSRLSDADLEKWKNAVEAYGQFLGNRNVFDDVLIQLRAELSATNSDKLPASIPAGAANALNDAMSLYLSSQWEMDDRANRFWIAVAKPLIASAGEELADAHSKVYGMQFPTRVLVNVSPFAGEFGGYTVGRPDLAQVVISSTDSGYQGFAALEMLMHEPSHTIVEPNAGAIGADLTKAAKELGVRPRHNLWHAILFYTSGELTRQALANRGVSNYQPVILNMYKRGYKGFKQPLETHWQEYLDGKISRETAIQKILIDTTVPKK